MPDNLFKIDTAMNIIKEDIIKELSEAVSKQNKDSILQDVSSSNYPFCEKRKD